MSREGQRVALRGVRALFEAGSVGGLTDRQLLERFKRRDGEAAEAAFGALVARHGPMVLRVCRQGLHDGHAADDAFQATFLVLVRRAGSLRAYDSLGPWLHAVARRVSACARSAEARRKAHERKAAEAPTASHGSGDWDDLGQVLHEEIDRLPERYRAAVVLCDLEGLTQDQAARQLGWPPGTVRSRLARGRARLQARLTRRGLAPAAGALAGLFAAESARAAVPASLAAVAVRTALLVAAGHGKSGAVAASATALSEGVLRAMLVTKIKLFVSAAVLLAGGAGGTAVLGYQPPEDQAGALEAQRFAGPAGGGSNANAVEEPSARNGPDTADMEAARGELALAESEVKRAEDRLEWAHKMYEKRYLSGAQLAADRLSLQKAHFALEQANEKWRRLYLHREKRTTKEDADVAQAEAKLKTARDRYLWASEMFQKGYVSRSGLDSEAQGLEKAQHALEQVRARSPVAKGTDRTNLIDELDALKRQYNEKLDELMWKQMYRRRIGRYAEAPTTRGDSQAPGTVSEVDRKKAEARRAAETANDDLLEAELNELNLRLTVAKKRSTLAAVGQFLRENERADQDAEVLATRLETARAALRAEQARLELAKAEMALNAVKKAKDPGSVTASERKKLEATVASAATKCDQKRAEIRRLERQANEAKSTPRIPAGSAVGS